jgi:histidine triad (HIT) family protein
MDLSQLTDEQRAEVEEKLKNMSPEELAKLQAQQCIFCQIISEKIPSKKVYEDDKCLAILDINPATKGHILLMPKSHISIMPQLDEKIGGHMMQVARELSRSLLKNLRATGSTIFIANGLAAGQRAQHFMLHIIPRKEGDEIFNYEKHIVDKDKRVALRNLVAARMEQLTDWTDIYASEENEDAEASGSEESQDVKETLEKEEAEKIDEGEDSEEDFGSEEIDRHDENGEVDETEESVAPRDTTDSSLDDIANLFK